MKDLHKNPMVYYITVPAIIALWPLLIWFTYLPKSEENLADTEKLYKNAEKIVEEILTLDPDRLDFADPNGKSAEFDYGVAVQGVARICKISASNWNLNSKPMKSKGQKSQGARVTLDNVDVTTFAKFLSELQFRWPKLECTKVNLTHKKGLTDAWKIDLDFRYYY